MFYAITITKAISYFIHERYCLSNLRETLQRKAYLNCIAYTLVAHILSHAHAIDDQHLGRIAVDF